MNQRSEAIEQPEEVESTLSTVLVPFAAGMVLNLISFGIGSPYLMMGVGLLAALVATYVWTGRPFSWVIFVAVSTANPANFGTPIAINLYSAAILLVVARGTGWRDLPVLVKVAFFFAILSMVVSILASLWADPNIGSIHTTDVSRPRPWMITWTGGATIEVLSSQVSTTLNYLLGPFLFIPLIFSRIRGYHAPWLLVDGLVFGLILPTLLLFLLARTFGQPVMDVTSVQGSLLSVASFRLGKLDIQMLRTQVGIPLASLICASFGVAISPLRLRTRLTALGCLVIAGYLLLVTGSVGSTLAALAGVVVILFLSLRHFPLRRYMALLFVGVMLALAAPIVLPQSIQSYASSRYELRVGKNSSSTADRAWRWKKALKYLAENPSGVGWSVFVEPLGIYPHNDYLTYAIAFGVVGGLIYLLYPSGLIFSFFSFTFFNRNAFDPPRLALALAGAGVATVLLVNSMSDHLTANRWYFNVVWSLIWYSFFASRAKDLLFGLKTPYASDVIVASKERESNDGSSHRRRGL